VQELTAKALNFEETYRYFYRCHSDNCGMVAGIVVVVK
jgi:hypothetical protein